MRLFLRLAVLFGFLLSTGCGGGGSKMADKPTEEQIKAAEQAQKQVDDEERGTPVKGKRR